MKTSNNGLELIRSHEGLRLKSYRCPGGVWTVGYGHTQGVHEGMIIDRITADDYLLEDVRYAEDVIGNFVTRPLNQHQFDALVSFIFNVGSGNFQSSTLLKRINADPSDPDIVYQFSRWNMGGGQVLPGLVRRRADEADMYFG